MIVGVDAVQRDGNVRIELGDDIKHPWAEGQQNDSRPAKDGAERAYPTADTGRIRCRRHLDGRD